VEPATYVMPIRREARSVDSELTRYLCEIGRRCELIVVDGSDSESFNAAHTAWSSFGLHVAPNPAIAGLNGKVRGVLTGVALASHERVVIADDDVRYDAITLERTIAALSDVELVRPQNYFAPLVWHARWDTARTLLNRIVGGVDFPGTLAVRRSVMRRTNGYNSDVLFENLELIRTVEMAGGRVLSPPDLYVRRIPPSTHHFWSQRRRQAYDELARPWRLLVYLALAPLAVWMLLRRRHRQVWLGALSAVLLAEGGRRRAGGAKVFPLSASLFAPFWLLERSVCSWLALVSWLRGGCPYAGRRLRTAATSRRTLRRRREPHAEQARILVPEKSCGGGGV
jgi:Glycosyltransferase like family 2